MEEHSLRINEGGRETQPRLQYQWAAAAARVVLEFPRGPIKVTDRPTYRTNGGELYPEGEVCFVGLQGGEEEAGEG